MMLPRFSRYSWMLAAAVLIAAWGCGSPERSEAQNAASAAAPFIERFNQIDRARWEVADGWNNGDWTSTEWNASQVRTGPGGLTITLGRNPLGADKPFSGGEIRAWPDYQFGYFEARMQVPRGSGLVTGLFTFTRPEGDRSWDEIDIEILGRNTHEVSFTLYASGAKRTTIAQLPFDAADGFHTYGFDWRRNAVLFYADGVLKYAATYPLQEIPQRGQRFMLDLWNSTALTDWVGPVHPEEAPWVLRVSCMAHVDTYPGQPVCR